MKLQRFMQVILFFSITFPASSEIILQNQVDSLVVVRPKHSFPMSGIVIISRIPSASASPEVARNLQRAHDWSVYENQNFETDGSLLIGGVGSVRDRQSVLRANVTRAQAFRMNSYK